MEWIPSALALLFMIYSFVTLLPQFTKSPQAKALLFFIAGLIIYHHADIAVWSQWHYRWTRRVASLGFYTEIPLLLYMLYVFLPSEKRTKSLVIISLILCLPWLCALALIKSAPLVYLQTLSTPNETLMYSLVVSFLIAGIFIAATCFKNAKSAPEKIAALLKTFGKAMVIMLVGYVILWSTIDAIGYDATYLFGVVNVIVVCMLKDKIKSSAESSTVTPV
jgi:hypothetical protein